MTDASITSPAASCKVKVPDTSPADTRITPRAWRVIAAASIGNALEWFDLAIYGFFAVTIAKVFFPTGNETTSLMLTLGTFGVSFFMRPLGAVVLGVYADRVGRKAALSISILLMMVGTMMIAIMPSYASIGIIAPIGVVLARMIQGFSSGGEFGSATAFLAEHSVSRRGFFASWQAASQGLTTLLAAAFGAILTNALSAAQLEDWGWRIPFFFGLLIGPLAYYIRTHMDEAPEFLAIKPTQTPLTDTFSNQKERLLLAIGVVVLATVSSYVMVMYMPTYAVSQLGISSSTIFVSILAIGVVQMVGAPFVGHWSDLHGRTGIMLWAAIATLLTAYPIFHLFTLRPTFGFMVGMQVVIGVMMITYYGALPALLTELFPTQTRTTGMSLGYNIAVTIFGGLAPFIITWLIQVSGNKLAPSFYLMAAAAISIAALLRIRKLNIK